jgi:hypothetical protein
MLVALKHSPQHFSGLDARLVHQAVANVQEQGERRSHDLVEVVPAIASLEAVDATDGEETLHPGEHGVGIVGLQQLNGNVDELGPLAGKVVLQDLAERGYELRANRGRCAGQQRYDAAPQDFLFPWGYGLGHCVVFFGIPSFDDAIF